MKKNKLIVGAVALGLGLASFGAGADAKGKPDNTPANAGAACVQDGIGFLKANGLLQAAAQKQIDYSLLGPDAEGSPFQGLIRVQLDEGSFLQLGQVVKLHTTNPELFTWCD